MVDVALLDSISDIGLGALLIGALIGGYRGWWIFGPVHRAIINDLVEQRNFWKEQALRGTALSERAVDVAVRERTSHAE